MENPTKVTTQDAVAMTLSSMEEVKFILKPSFSRQDLSAEKKIVAQILNGAKNSSKRKDRIGTDS